MPMRRLREASEQALYRFDIWFASTAGCYQTLIFVLAIVLFEQIWPHLDVNHFAVLYFLTVYSAITQPALAHTGKDATDRLEKVMAQVAELDRDVEATTYLQSHDIAELLDLNRRQLALLTELQKGQPCNPPAGSPTGESTSR